MCEESTRFKPQDSGSTSPPEATTFSPDEVVADRFRIVRFVAKGGMGEVYEAMDVELRETVALKTILATSAADQEAMQRFRREIQLSRKVTHPHVGRVFDLFRHGDVHFFSMEFLSGETLAQRIRRSGRLTVEDASPVVRQLASALAAAHEVGVVHRDFKPENVILVPAGHGDRAVVTDFGLARGVALEDVSLESVTATGMFVGTPAYMAPEQLEGEEITSAADIYAFGVVLYQMMTGVRPFDGATPLLTAMKRLKEKPRPPTSIVPDLPEHWESTILSCLEREPERRFPRAADIPDALGSRPQRHPAVREGDRRTLPPRFLSQRRRSAAAALVLLLFLGGSYLMTRRDTGANETVRLSRLVGKDEGLASLQSRLQSLRIAGASVERVSDDTVRVVAPESELANAVSAVEVIDALSDFRFHEEPNLFNGPEPSSRLVTLDIDMPLPVALSLLAGAAGWPAIVDGSVDGRAIFELTEVAWDVAVQTILDVNDLRTLQHGSVWLVADRERINDLQRGEPLEVAIQKPERTPTGTMAEALQAAASERGVVAVNPRLGAVVVADRIGVMDRYARVFAAVDRSVPDELDFPRRQYRGEEIGVELLDADVGDVLRLFGRISGLNVVYQGTGSARREWNRINITAAGVAWDNVFEVVLLSQNLSYRLQDNVVQVVPESTEFGETIVETVSLENEDAEFFRAFETCLSPEGSLQIETQSGTLIIRDRPSSARWFSEWARRMDRMRPH